MEDDQLILCSNWRFAAVTVGWLAIAFSIGLAAFFTIAFFAFDGTPKNEFIVMFVICGLTILASIIWLRSFNKKKANSMLMSLICWAVPLTLWTFYLLYSTFDGILERKIDEILHTTAKHGKKYNNQSKLPYFLTVFCIALYYTAVMSYMSMKQTMKVRRTEARQIDTDYGTRAENTELVQIATTSKEQ